MANANCNKVVVNGVTKVDLTSDTVDAASVASGKTFHDKTGAKKTGTYSFTSATSATAAASNITSTKTAWVNGQKLTGTHTCPTHSCNIVTATASNSSNSQSMTFSVSVPSGAVLKGAMVRIASGYTATNTNRWIQWIADMSNLNMKCDGSGGVVSSGLTGSVVREASKSSYHTVTVYTSAFNASYSWSGGTLTVRAYNSGSDTCYFKSGETYRIYVVYYI